MAVEKTLVVIKPDGVRRGLAMSILARFEKVGLSVDAIRVSRNENEIYEAHYPTDSSWLGVVGGKTLQDHEKQGISVADSLGTDDPVEIGAIVRGWLVSMFANGTSIPAVLSGNRSVEVVRKLVGNTLPVLASPGTIRGDYSSDSTDLANEERRPVSNLIHASGDPEEAAREIKLWFPSI